MPKPTRPASEPVKFKHQNGLEDDILATGRLSNKDKTSKKRTRREDEDGGGYVDSKSTRKILKIGQDLADEARDFPVTESPNTAFNFESRYSPGSEEGDEDEAKYEEEDVWGEDEDVEETEIDPGDLALFNKFLPPGEEPTLDLHTVSEDNGQDKTNLADIILAQIAAHEAVGSGEPVHGGGLPEEAVELPAKAVEVYEKCGIILSRYKSGKIPKPFKILPTLPHWEELLSITRPDRWTPNAVYEATRIFVSSSPGVVRTFLENVLLERVREDIQATKRLNVHLYKSLQKACYKPRGFFMGILFPLVEGNTCSLREAHIISSVITKCSIPALHSAAALLRMTDIAAEQASVATEGGGATNIFIRAFLEKGYALPYKVVDGLVFHFLRFRGATPASTDHKLPVLWHQSLLSFAQRYRNDITEDQREALLDLLLACGHRDIGPEVRRELLEGRGRGVVIQDNNSIIGGDDTMLVDPV